MSIGLKLAEPKLLVPYTLFLIILSAILATVLAVGYGLYQNMLWIGSGGFTLTPMVVDVNAKTIYTGRVPLSTYISLSRDENVGRTIPVILALSFIEGRPIVVRGMMIEDLKSDYGPAMLEGSMLSEGSFAVVGFKVAENLGLKPGDIIHLVSVKSGRLVTLMVCGVYRLGDQRDYEIAVNMELARLLAEMPPDCLSAIIAPEADKSYLEKNLKAVYNLTIESQLGFKATVILADSLGRVYREFEVSGNSTRQIALPYGYYSIYVRSDGKITFINSILVNRNMEVLLRKPSEKVVLRVLLISKDTLVELKSLDGETIEPVGVLEDSLIYSVERGSYMLIYDGETYPLSLSEDSTFTPPQFQPIECTLKVKVYDYLGRKVKGVILNILDPRGNNIVYSRLLEEGEGGLKLPPGRYRVLVSDSLTTAERTLELKNDSLLEFKLPALSRKMPSRIMSELERVRLLEGVNYIELSLRASLGLTLEHCAALYLSLTALTLVAFIPVNIYYLSSIRERLRLLILLGFKPGDILLKVGLPGLLAASIASAMGFQLSKYMWETFSLGDKILILGYGLPPPPWWLSLPVILAAIALWICCFSKELRRK